MDGLAIRVRGIGKRYGVGSGRSASSLVDRVGRMAGSEDRNPFADGTIWALRNISFDVPKGQVLGLIGRNGAGKTTLVQILARITAPTEGSAIVDGRVGVLFQMGAGFHPELSGRENILLSGAVLGMSDEEVAAVYDRIVAFSEIEEFLDYPVKHYSSGMYARLAFSVSAHLSAEILLVDEGLSAGDLRFAEKCAAHIRDMVRDGRTVVFVSHILASMRELCDSGIVLDRGEMQFQVPSAMPWTSTRSSASRSPARRSSRRSPTGPYPPLRLRRMFRHRARRLRRAPGAARKRSTKAPRRRGSTSRMKARDSTSRRAIQGRSRRYARGSSFLTLHEPLVAPREAP